MGKTKELIFPLLIGLIYSFSAAYFQWDTFGIRYSQSDYEQMYANSQYVLGEKSIKTMGDGDIYVYSGIKYLSGQDPTSINFEHPPFAKIVYGASYLLTGYPNFALIPLVLILVLSFWYLTRVVFSSEKYRYLSLGLLLLHSTIFKESGRTMLDLPQTSVLLLSTVAFCYFIKKHSLKASVLFGITIGTLLLTKYAFPLIGIYIVLLFISALINKMPVINLLASSGTVIFTYLVGYLQFFIHGHSLIDLLKFEWWRWKWYQGKVDNPKLLIWEVIFFGKYKQWWNGGSGYVYFPHWSILWPITALGYIFSWAAGKINFKQPLFPYKLWILIALAALSLGAYEDRFLTPLIPGFILFGVQAAADIAKKWDNK